MPMAQRKRGEKDPDARQRAGKAKSCDGEKPPLATPLPVRSIPPKMPQEHGGAIYQGGVLGHRGGNQHTVRARSEELRGEIQDELGRLIADLRAMLEAAREGGQARCARCGAFIPAVPKLSIEQASILIDRLAKHGISNSPDDAPLVPIQVIVAAGGPVVPYRPDEE